MVGKGVQVGTRVEVGLGVTTGVVVNVGRGVRVAGACAKTWSRTVFGIATQVTNIQPRLVIVTRLAVTRRLTRSFQSLTDTS
jgi:hypothetical protein